MQLLATALLLMLMVMSPTLTSGQVSLTRQTCDSSKRYMDLETSPAPQALLGGLMAVRNQASSGVGCGAPALDVMQGVEAARFTLETLNGNNFIPAVRLGMRLYDTCSSNEQAMSSAQMFLPQIASSPSHCQNNTSQASLGLVGPMYAESAMGVGQMLGPLPAITIATRVASDSLSDKSTYPTTLRTSASTTSHAKAIVAVMKNLGWERAHLVYEDSGLGRSGLQALLSQGFQEQRCFVQALALPSGTDAAGIRTRLATLSTQTDVVVFYGTGYLAVKVMEALNADRGRFGRLQWILPFLSLNAQLSNVEYARGALVVKPEIQPLSQFMSRWNAYSFTSPPLNNPWFQDWFRAQYNCDNNGGLNDCSRVSNRASQVQEEVVDNTVKAVYAFASAFKTALSQRCSPSTVVCDNVRSMSANDFASTYLFGKTFTVRPNEIPGWDLSFSFDNNGDILAPEYAIYNLQANAQGNYAFTMIGRFSNVQPNMSTPVFYDSLRSSPRTGVTSPCPSQGCRNCLLPSRSIYYDYLPGTVLLGMLFDTRARGRDPLTCGDLWAPSGQAWLAARFALEQVQARTSLLPGVTLGAVMADVCSDELLAQSFVSGMLSGMTQLRDSSGQTIDTNRVRAFVDFTSTRVARAASQVLGSWGVPEVQAGATGDELGDRTRYPTFSRDIPADRTLANVAISVLQKLSWDYVQVIYVGDLKMAAMDFRQQAALASICVASMMEIGSDYNDVVRRLRMNGNARGVVVYGGEEAASGLFSAVRDLNAAGEFTFLAATEQWGDRIPQPLRAAANGTLYLRLGGSPRQDFEIWLGQVSMDTVRSNPALSQWYQTLHDCYLDAASRGQFNTPCTGNSITSSPRYTQSQYAGYVIDAVYAAASALDSTLKRYCGATYRGLCSQFRGSSEVKMTLLDFLRNVSYFDGNRQVALQDGESTAVVEVMLESNGAATKVGEYSSSRMTLTSWTLPSVTRYTCTGRCSECYYVTQAGAKVLVPGDVMLGGVFFMSNPSSQGPYVCGDVKTSNGYQFAAAMLYALKRLNQDGFPVALRGINLGALILDHCNTPSRSDALLSGLYGGQSDPAWSMGSSTSFLADKLLAWLTDVTVSGQEVGQLLQPLRIPVISPSATSRSLMTFPDFFRTVQGDDTVALAMLKLVKTFNLNYVQVVHSANAYGRGGVTAVQAAAQQVGMCVTGTHEISASNPATAIVSRVRASTVHVLLLYLGPADASQFLSAANGSSLLLITPVPYTQVAKTSVGNPVVRMMSVRLRSPVLTDFQDFLNARVSTAASTDPILQEYYQVLHQCNLPGSSRYSRPCTPDITRLTSSSQWSQSEFALSTVNAVFAVASALHATLTQRCGPSYSGFCSNFSSAGTRDLLLRNLAATTFRDEAGRDFRFIDREGNSVYDILQFDGNDFQKVGSYGGATLEMTNFVSVFANVASRCDPPCQECIQRGLNFSYVPGDILLGGLFDVHVRDVNPFSCGEINTLHGVQLLEAFHFALRTVNAKLGMFANILPGVRLGGVGLDSCQSAVRTGYLVSNVHNGLTQLSRSGDVIDPADIDAYVGAYSSDRTLYLARIMTALKMPLISYAASTTELLDQFRYPYFYRTVPADDNQARAMASFLANYDIRYVQILHTRTSYGELGASAFRQMAAEYKICVSQTVIFPDNGTASKESANDVVNLLLQKPVSNTVILFAPSEYVKALLEAINRVPKAKGKFRFIGSESWAVNEEAITGVEENAVGSVTLNLESKELSSFEQYLSAKTADDTQENPWFPEYYQKILDCYLSLPDPRYSQRCDQTSGSIKSHYSQDPGVLHVINSVYAAALALDSALRQVCGSQYNGVCESYRNRQDRQLILLNHLQNVSFTDPSGVDFTFTERREGRKGYDFFSITYLPVSGYSYNKVGSFSAAGNLTTVPGYTPAWRGDCAREDACSECPTIRNQGIRYDLSGRQGTDAMTVVGVFDVHARGTDDYRCGSLNLEGGFQQYLAFSYFVDVMAPVLGLDIRGLALDTCSNPIRTDQDLYSLLADRNLCNAIFDAGKGIGIDTVGGVVTSGDAITMAAGRVLEPLSLSYVASSATSVRFDNRAEYSWLARAVSPFSNLFRVISRLLRQRGWTYLSAIYSDSMAPDFQAFGAKVTEDENCLGSSTQLPAVAQATDADAAITDVQQAFFSRVVVLLTNARDTRLVLEAARGKGVLDDYLWVIAGPDGLDVQSLPPGLQFSALVLEPRSTPVLNFVSWMAGTSYTSQGERNNRGIPREWFEEFYQVTHNCYLEDALERLTTASRRCNKSEVITQSMIRENKYLLNTLAATDAMARASRDACSDIATVSCLQQEGARQRILDRVLAVRANLNSDLMINISESFQLSFTSERFWDQGYRIRKVDYDTTVNPSRATDSLVGSWNGGALSLSNPNFMVLTSACPPEASCACVRVSPQTGTQTDSGPQLPLEPRNYYLYDNDTTLIQVYNWPLWAIVVAAFTCIGLLLALLAFFFLLVSYPIRGGTTILAFLSQLGIMGIYAINFAFFVPAAEASCGARRFVMGVVYAIVFACLLVKAVDNWRYRETDYSSRRYAGVTSALALLLVAVGIILIQVIIPTMWLILVPPGAEWLGPATGIQHDWWWCTPTHFYDIGLVLSFLFVIFLVFLTSVFAAMAWDCEANVYESRWILYSAICTAGCFLVWMIVTTNAGPPYRDPAVAIANLVNATCLLITGPLRKVILLIQVRSNEKRATENHQQYQEEYLYSNATYEPDADYGYQAQDGKAGSDVGF